VVPGACLSQIVTNSDTSNTHKHPKTPTNTHKTPTNTHKEWCYHTSFFVSELRPFKVKDKFFQCIFEALFINSANALLLTAVWGLWLLWWLLKERYTNYKIIRTLTIRDMSLLSVCNFGALDLFQNWLILILILVGFDLRLVGFDL